MKEPEKKPWIDSFGDKGTTAVACILFSICSASMLLLNASVARQFRLDATVVSIQMIFASAVCSTVLFSFLRLDNWRDVLLWSATVPWLFSCMMITSITSLRHASVGMSNVIRNISPLLTMPIEHFLVHPIEIDVHTVFSLLVILAGIVLYVHEDVHSEVLGIVLLVVNMIFAMSDRLVQRRFLGVKPLDISKTGMMLLNNSVGLLPQIPMLLIFDEIPQWQSRLAPSAHSPLTWTALAMSCVVGICIGWTAMNAQRHISATSFMVLGNVNKVVVWVIGMIFYGDVRTPLAIFGAVIALGGGVYYGWARNSIDDKNRAAKAAAAVGESKSDAPTEASVLIKK
jgi:drug/metabolite transporter (DMT)-like permease